MTKSVFSSKLYAEGMRQLRAIGIINTILYILFSAMILVPDLILYYREPEYMSTGEVVNLISIAPVIILSIFVFAPIYIHKLFKFMEKRCPSDFYHSIPQTRLCLFTSFSAAAITWMMIPILISSAVSIGLASILYTINLQSILPTLFCIIVGGLSVMGAYLIAKSITGTLFSGICVALIILFFPRLLILFATLAVQALSPVVALDLSPFVNMMSIPVKLVYNVFIQNSSLPEILTAFNSTSIYTLVLSVVYFVIGGLLFVKRNSETATKATASPVLQTIFRICATLVFCLPAIYAICDTVAGSGSSNLEVIIVFYLLAIVAYFLYEFITTQKISNIIGAIPGLGVVAILNVVAVFSIVAVSNFILDFRPAADEIDSVSVYYSDLDYQQGPNYFHDKAQDIEISDSEMSAFVAQALANDLDELEADAYLYDDYSLTVKINADGATKNRVLYLTQKEYDTFTGLLAQNDDYRKVYYTLPDASRNATSIQIVLNASINLNLDDEQKTSIYQNFCIEKDKINFKDWYSLMEGSGGDYFGTFKVQTADGSRIYNVSIPIPYSCTDTISTLFDLAMEDKDNAKALQTAIDALENDALTGDTEAYQLDATSYYLGINVFDLNAQQERYISIATPEQAKSFGEYLSKQANSTQTSGQSAYVYIYYEDYTPLDQGKNESLLYLPVLKVNLSELPEDIVISDTSGGIG